MIKNTIKHIFVTINYYLFTNFNSLFLQILNFLELKKCVFMTTLFYGFFCLCSRSSPLRRAMMLTLTWYFLSGV